ncbi:MAG: ATP synthase F1 subunit delta [Oscillospiraceae bacterium]|jgi:F-type H+-transporting ATPase subunit delta|nr:ATP synthase F1 subunit delta [Oscillospiraceae bacterium]MBQ5711668.1 ATP synthase F1 subunit delta [Oscillospiraceae bacterium]
MTEAGSVYGQALYDLAAGENLTKTILDQLSMLQHCFTVEEPQFLKLLSSPNLSKQERCKILDDSFRGMLHPYVLNFLKLMTEKGYIRHFPDSVDAYRDNWYRDNDILVVKAVSAVSPTAEQLTRLTQKLSKITGKSVDVRWHIDPSVIGGVRLDYDGKRLDDTVSHRLDAVRAMLKNTVL